VYGDPNAICSERADDFERPTTAEEAAKWRVVVSDFDHREVVATGSWPILGDERLSAFDLAPEANHAWQGRIDTMGVERGQG